MKKIHVICKTHLDLGYTDYAENIEKLYREKFIPEAIELAKELNTDKKRFIWTLGSWVIENALKYSDESVRAELDGAIRRGDIVPHGIPFTTHTELLDEDTVRYGLEIAVKLKSEYKLNIISAKMTDVPGHTGAIVPLLEEYGIKLLHIGVNEGSAIPDVPKAFLWKYGSGEIVVVYEGSYGSLYKNEYIDDILCFAHSSDNKGPNSKKNILKLYEKLEREYPDYEVSASTLDNYAAELIKVKDKLPVVTSEIGDSWIHGAASDPYKSAALRELIHLKNKWLSDRSLKRGDAEYDNLANYILTLAEHTCGMDVKKHLSDVGVYLKKDFNKARAADDARLKFGINGLFYKSHVSLMRLKGEYNKGSYRVIEKSWQEQRDYIDSAVRKLSAPHREEAVTRLQSLIPQKGFDRSNMKEISYGQTVSAGGYTVAFNARGAIKDLTYNDSALISDNENTLIDYQSFNSRDYEFWRHNYTRAENRNTPWVLGDFLRPALKYYDNKFPSGVYGYSLKRLLMTEDESALYIISELTIDVGLTIELGAPRTIEVKYTFFKQEFKIAIELIWLDKDASRLTEALFMHMNFDFSKDLCYYKLGRKINPYDIVINGNRHLAAVWKVEFDIDKSKYKILNCHAPLVSLGKGKILRFDNKYEDIGDGITYILYNNVWGTNFPLWYSDNAYFKFEITKG